jgi:hypothetical protein
VAKNVTIHPNAGRVALPNGTVYNATGPRNAVQEIQVSDGAAGEFTLGFGGQTSAAITVGAAPEQVQSALIGLSTIGAGEVLVTQGVTNNPHYVAPPDAGRTYPYRVEFLGTLGESVQDLITVVSHPDEGGHVFVHEVIDGSDTGAIEVELTDDEFDQISPGLLGANDDGAMLEDTTT